MFNIKTFSLKFLVVSRFLLIFAEEIITNKTKTGSIDHGRDYYWSRTLSHQRSGTSSTTIRHLVGDNSAPRQRQHGTSSWLLISLSFVSMALNLQKVWQLDNENMEFSRFVNFMWIIFSPFSWRIKKIVLSLPHKTCLKQNNGEKELFATWYCNGSQGVRRQYSPTLKTDRTLLWFNS